MLFPVFPGVGADVMGQVPNVVPPGGVVSDVAPGSLSEGLQQAVSPGDELVEKVLALWKSIEANPFALYAVIALVVVSAVRK